MIGARGDWRDGFLLRLGVLVGTLASVCLALGGSAAGEPSELPFEITPESFHVIPSTTQAGAHADLTISFDFAHLPTGKTDNDVRSVIVNLPPGFIGNDTAVPTCTDAQLIGGSSELPACPLASQIGQISFKVVNDHVGSPPAHFTVPLYNMEVTSFGVTAEFGFKTILFTQVLQASVRSGDSGVTTTTPDIGKAEPFNVSAIVWGLPASHAHDAQRGETCGEGQEVPPLCVHTTGDGGPQEAHIPIKPFLSNPTSCGPHMASMEADSWEEPEEFVRAEAGTPAMGECERVPFEPSIEVAPTTRSAESPSGLNISLVVPQTWENPYSIATANLKDTTVALPVGYTANPSLASGLGASAARNSSKRKRLPRRRVRAVRRNRRSARSKWKRRCSPKRLTGNIYVAKPYRKPRIRDARTPGWLAAGALLSS